jgi:hypothetical protein
MQKSRTKAAPLQRVADEPGDLALFDMAAWKCPHGCLWGGSGVFIDERRVSARRNERFDIGFCPDVAGGDKLADSLGRPPGSKGLQRGAPNLKQG